MRTKALLLTAAVVISLSAVAKAQEAVALSELPTIAESGSDFCGYLRSRKADGMSDLLRSQLSRELGRRGGFNSTDRRILLKPGERKIGLGMSLQGLRCALGNQVRVVKVWKYGGLQTWQVELFPDYWRYSIGYAYMEGNGSQSGMRVRSLI